ncbi:MAG TPA: DUF998 domain-containing protein [Chloroflexota bacterium]|nr:DUF998 domain-containing protein [Chloroflexota bacterium]
MTADTRRSHVPGRTRSAPLLSWIAIGGVVTYVALDIIVQALPPHDSPIRQPESDLAVGPYGWIMTINFVVRAILSGAILVALKGVLLPSWRTLLGLAFLGTWTAGALLLALFPADVGRLQTVHGGIHLAVAALAFVSMPIGAVLLSRSLAMDARWADLGQRVMPFAYLTVAGFAVLVLGSVMHRISGLTERLFLASALLWILILAINLGQETAAGGAPEP